MTGKDASKKQIDVFWKQKKDMCKRTYTTTFFVDNYNI